MQDNRAVHDAFVSAGLRVKDVGLWFGPEGTVLTASGWHPDGTPFEFISEPLSTDPVERAHEAAAELVAVQESKKAPAAAQAPAAPENSAMSKLHTISDRINALKDSFEQRSDALLGKISEVEERGNAAFEKHEQYLAARTKELAQLEDTISQLTNGAA